MGGGGSEKRERERENKEFSTYLTGPLDMDAISRVDIQSIWYKVVLHCGVHLDNVSSLSSDVEVVKPALLTF